MNNIEGLRNFSRITRKYFSLPEDALDWAASKVFKEDLEKETQAQKQRDARSVQEFYDQTLKEAEKMSHGKPRELWFNVILSIYHEGKRRTEQERKVLFNLLISNFKPVFERVIWEQEPETIEEQVELFDYAFPNSPAKKLVQRIFPVVMQAVSSQQPLSFSEKFFQQ